MKPIFSYHEGSQAERPAEVDTTSSRTVVYLRRNIQQITREDEQSGAAVTLWGYEEAQLTPEEYAIYIGETADAKADYIAMMADIDIEEV